MRTRIPSVRQFLHGQNFYNTSDIFRQFQPFQNRWDFIYLCGSQIHDSLFLNIDSGKNIENSKKDATFLKYLKFTTIHGANINQRTTNTLGIRDEKFDSAWDRIKNAEVARKIIKIKIQARKGTIIKHPIPYIVIQRNIILYSNAHIPLYLFQHIPSVIGNFKVNINSSHSHSVQNFYLFCKWFPFGILGSQ